MPLISLSFIILAIDSTVMLNKNNGSEQPYLTLDLRGKALSLFTIEYDGGCVVCL